MEDDSRARHDCKGNPEGGSAAEGGVSPFLYSIVLVEEEDEEGVQSFRRDVAQQSKCKDAIVHPIPEEIGKKSNNKAR